MPPTLRPPQGAMMNRWRLPLSLALVLVLLPLTVNAALLSLGKPVTASGYYNNGGSEIFPPGNVTDGRYNDSGEPGNWSFWVARLGTLDYFTIDLQGMYTINSFTLQNTHNRDHYDLGTLDFRIALSADDSAYTTVVDDTLVYYSSTPIPTQSFTITPATARYVRFYVDSYVSYGGGLNEMEVYGSGVPLPPSVLLLGAGLLGLGLPGLRRRIKRG